MMIRINDNIINTDFVKGARLRPEIGDIKIYFSDRTAKTFLDDYSMSYLLDDLHDKASFIEIGNDYINPYLVKGFENLNDGRVKIYFPDTTALTLYIDDDGFEELVQFFKDLFNEDES